MSSTRLLQALSAALLIALTGIPAAADPPTVGPAAVLQSEQNDVSGALRDLPAKPPRTPTVLRKIPRQPLPRRTPGTPKGLGLGADPVIQSAPGAVSMPSTISNFEGVGNVDGVLPPDTTGDVGPNHYVQWVNLSYAVYSKAGAVLLSPRDGNTIWAGFGGPCASTNNGDPVVLYDHLADRWVLSQFALPNGLTGPFYQCIAVSQTGDPTGAFHRYAFLISNTKLNDYPKLGVWPDGYYMAVNQFVCNAAGFCNWSGQGVVVFEREKMLSGQAARGIYWDLYATNPDLGGMLPSDLDGPAAPTGTPNFFVQFDDDAWGYSADQLQVWALTPNWASPSASTFSRVATLPTAAFDSNLCGYSRNCIPQPGTAAKVDGIPDRLMYRLQYRNFGTHQTLVSNHTVDTGGDHAGIRWYELRNPGNGWGIHQQGTYAPADGAHRWMGSIAMDGTGGMALGMSVASGSVYPSIRYTGRIPSAPPGTMSEAESELIAGSGVQTHSSGRWGDYSTMSVDPTDDCTFWYTQEYYPTTSSAGWHTRIGSFKLPSCGAAALPTLSIADATVTEGNSGTGNAVFTVTLLPASDQVVTVNYTTGNGTAIAGEDFTATSGQLTFAVGETSKPVTVQVTGDTTVESNETFTVSLSNPTNATVADGQGLGTILNDDTAPAPAGTITVAMPNGGESWPVRTTKTITWTSSGISGNVRIELSRDNGGTWSLLVDNTPNDGAQAWKVNGKPTTTARIRVCTMATPAICDTSDAVFRIVR